MLHHLMHCMHVGMPLHTCQRKTEEPLQVQVFMVQLHSHLLMQQLPQCKQSYNHTFRHCEWAHCAMPTLHIVGDAGCGGQAAVADVNLQLKAIQFCCTSQIGLWA